MQLFYSFVFLLLLLPSAFSMTSENEINQRYQGAFFTVINQTNEPIVFTIDHSKGKWLKPVVKRAPILICPSQQYHNTLISEKKNGNFISYTSMNAAQASDERHNYVVFGQQTNSKKQLISQHIFDGLGKIFVDSESNHCDDTTSKGYASCVMLIK